MRSSLRLFSACLIVLASPTSFAATCPEMAALAIDGLNITAAEHRDSEALAQNFGRDEPLPAHCRIAAVLTPTDDSHIEMELWLPADWNGKFLAVGNGGWAGSISLSAMARGLASGYAVASNDTGHKGGSAAFAVGHPEKLVDFAWRAMHEMAVHSKAMIAAFYARPPRLSYYEGCSTGGRQGLMEAQRFPADFDGIIAGAPVNNVLALNASQFHNLKFLLENRSAALSPGEVQLLHDAVLAACEINDGVRDGFLNDPLACGFDAKSLQCSDTRRDACLTPEQVRSVEAVYAGVHSSAGELVYPGHAKGFELGWRIPADGSAPPALQTDATRYLVYADADWDWREFELERDLALVREKAGYIEALETDLSEFKARGGKLLLYHGWNDPGPSPLNTIAYFDDVLATMGPGRDEWLRLFLLPGVGHCRGGVGPDDADFLAMLEAWVENDSAPERIVASRVRDGRVEMTRPLCSYPAVAVWNGEGDPNEASSYSCRNESAPSPKPTVAATTAGSLRSQAEAILAARRARLESANEVPVGTTIQVDPALAEQTVASAGDCRVMPAPGSRIMRERCYYPSDGERELNSQQFRDDLRTLRDATIRAQIERQAADAARRQQRGGFR